MIQTAYFWPLVVAAQRALAADDHYRTVAHKLDDEARLRALADVAASKRALRAVLDRIAKGGTAPGGLAT